MEQRALKLERNYYDYLNFLNASKNLEGTIKETKLIYSEVLVKNLVMRFL